jgi:hypothetical protein
MNRPESEFFINSLGKNLLLINLHGQFKTGNIKQKPKEVKSMRDIKGLI